METPSRHSFTLNGSTRVFPIPSPIKGDNYCRLEVDGTIINDRTKYDIVNNSIVFVDAADVPAGSQLDVLVVQSEEAIGQLTITTNIDIVASNIADVNTTADSINSVNTVAGNITDVNRVATSADNLDRVHTSIDNLDRVDTSIDKLDRVYTSITNLDRVHTSIDNLDRVDTSIDKLDRVYTSIAKVDTVNDHIANVDTNADHIANIDRVATSADEVDRVYTSIAKVDRVYTSIANVDTVNDHIANVDTTAGHIANVDTVAGHIANVDTVATNDANVTTVAGISGNVTKVANIDTNVTTVANNDANVTTVAGISANVTKVANIDDKVTTVANNDTNVTSVADNMTGLNTIVTNMTEILNADTNAATATTKASEASASAVSAAQSAASAASVLDNFDDRYLGAKASDPATDNDGQPLIVGALYFNSTDGVMKIYTASGWLAASSASVATMAKYRFTATAGQTVFTGADDGGDTLSMTVGSEIVTLNGIVLEAGTDYTPASGSVTLATGATADDEVNVYAFGNFQVADTVSKSLGGTFSGDVNVLGNVGIGTSSLSSNYGSLTVAGTGISIADDGYGKLQIGRFSASAPDSYIKMGANSNSLRFTNATDSADVMTIEHGGNVGIGTNSPSQKLQVDGTISSMAGLTEYHTYPAFQYKQSASEHIAQYKKTSNSYAYYWRTTDDGTTYGPNSKTVAEWYNNSMHFYTDGVERLKIDSAGRVTMPYQPAFSAYGANTTSPNTVVVYYNTRLNIGNHYNTTTGLFTAPIAGTYCFHASAYVTDGGFALYQVNGSTDGTAPYIGYIVNGSNRSVTTTFVVPLQAGDTVNVATESSTTTASSTPRNNFSGYLLG